LRGERVLLIKDRLFIIKVLKGFQKLKAYYKQGRGEIPLESKNQFEEYKSHLTIGLANEKLKQEGMEIAIPTMRNWVNDLHQLQIHTIPRNARGERIFSSTDIEIIRFIKKAKTEFTNNLTMQAIGNMIQSQEIFKDHLHYDPNDNEIPSEMSLSLSESRLKELFKNEMEELKEMKHQLNELKENYETRLELMPNPEEDKKQRALEYRQYLLDKTFAENKVRRRLRDAAIEEWRKDPKTTGIFIKREDAALKSDFIELYISTHFEEEMLKEYGVIQGEEGSKDA